MIQIDIEMPSCCIDCPIYNNEFGCCNLIPNSTFYGDGVDIYNPLEERNKDCPLKEDTLGKNGKWIFFESGYLECSNCGEKDEHLKYSNFCPDCGADMRNTKK